MSILIHPGLHKTGTTYLQDCVFGGDPTFHSLFSHAEVDGLLVRPHQFDWEPDRAHAAVERARVGTGETRPVLSSELLAGNPLLGATSAVTLAQRLHQVAPDARILLTVRRQAGMATALYQQYLKRGGTGGPNDFLSPRREPGYPGFDPTLLRYDRYARLYADLFGTERVLVLPQEHLAANGTDFVRRVADFIGRPLPDGWRAPSRGNTGRSPPLGGHPVFRVANHLRRSPMNPGGLDRRGAPGRWLASVAWRTTIGGSREGRRIASAITAAMPDGVDPSNRRLQPFCPVDLATLGYQLSPKDD